MNKPNKSRNRTPRQPSALRQNVEDRCRELQLPAAAVDEAMKHDDPLARLQQIADKRRSAAPKWEPVEREADVKAVEEPPAQQQTSEAPPPAADQQPLTPHHSPATASIREVVAELRLPLVDPAGKYISRHIEVGGLTSDQAETFKSLVLGLEETNARLANGQRVTSNADGLRWLLEQLAAAKPQAG